MLVIVDLHNGREFPMYVSPNKSLAHAKAMWRKTHKVQAVYDLNRPFSDQSDSFRTLLMTTMRKVR